MIDLTSDTVTRPTPEMLDYMVKSEVGDDVFGLDPTVNRLQDKAAKMFGKEAALFCPSGTMTNQIAIKVNTQPMDDVICDIDSHIYRYEAAGYSFNSGVGISLVSGSFGKITASQIKSAILPGHDWQPTTRLVSLENTTNRGGGSYYTLDEIRPIYDLCKSHSLRLHLDGARIFNALVESGEDTEDWGKYFDTISVCLSKGLGAPVGSLLLGSRDDINKARRYRKVMGGGMRQAGFLAAAGIYALDNHIPQLKIDNQRAREIGHLLESMSYIKEIKPVHTNILIFILQEDINGSEFLIKLKKEGILATSFGENTIRFVFHRDITQVMMEGLTTRLIKVI